MAPKDESTDGVNLLAWKVDAGRFNGVPLGGLAVVAAVSGDGATISQ